MPSQTTSGDALAGILDVELARRGLGHVVEHALGHARARVGGDGVGEHAVAAPLGGLLAR